MSYLEVNQRVKKFLFKTVIIGLLTLVGVLGFYFANHPASAESQKVPIPLATTPPKPPVGWEITTTSGESEIALAKHLTKIGGKMYGAFWCPHCYEQKQLFGKEAFKQINYIECDAQGVNPQTQLCRQAEIEGYPTWDIKGQRDAGTQSLDGLARISEYKGPKNFKYKMPN
jgi:thiol-disulfide isomerase/thioredoxin